MKREIKFRAWDAKEKQMLEVNHLFNLGNKQPIEVWTNDYEGGYRFNPDKSEIMQYTGLKDVNGVEIYEGDIVKNEYGKVMDIQYDPRSAAFDIGDYYFGTIGSGKILEVIGNIYENQELLGVEE